MCFRGVVGAALIGDKPATVEDVMPIATGLEREELAAELKGEKRFDMDPPVGPFGTKLSSKPNSRKLIAKKKGSKNTRNSRSIPRDMCEMMNQGTVPNDTGNQNPENIAVRFQKTESSEPDHPATDS
uniref:Uncharacterized protein n=1 Tax=Oryza glumipatula TaxID=40148 RepID=A0A0D9YBM4_9ORYZ